LILDERGKASYFMIASLTVNYKKCHRQLIENNILMVVMVKHAGKDTNTV
jgi:hypothetical protein